METPTTSQALTDFAPRTAVLIVMVVPGPPVQLQIDMMRTSPTGDSILARYRTAPGNTLEAVSAFELLLAGTLMGQKQSVPNLTGLPALSTEQ